MNVIEMQHFIDLFVDKQCGGGASDSEISAAEKMLDVQFPFSYRQFLNTYGWGRFSHDELYGLGTDIPTYLQLVKHALAERYDLSPPMPPHLVPVMNDGAGNHFCLDTSTLVDNECPIVFWDHELSSHQTPELVAHSFDRWLVELLRELSGD